MSAAADVMVATVEAADTTATPSVQRKYGAKPQRISEVRASKKPQRISDWDSGLPKLRPRRALPLR